MPQDPTSSQPTWLITGGAGYIGAHIVHAMLQSGRRVVIYDDLSTGSQSRTQGAPFVEGSVLDRELLESTLKKYQVEGVLHIAAKKQVGESVSKPLYYYEQNVTGLQTLLAAMGSAGVARIVMSSSAATYGTPDEPVLTETTRLQPMSPYGETKVIGEWLLAAAARASELRYVALRYFNVSGAATPGLGDPGIFNLVPLVFEAMSRGQRPKIFGSDYPTTDGTCIRDYVHVADIADAHLAAIDHLAGGDVGGIYNVGTGHGSSVREVIAAIERATGRQLDPQIMPRREGDPASSVGSVAKIARDFGWHARYDLDAIVSSAWKAWVAAHPEVADGS